MNTSIRLPSAMDEGNSKCRFESRFAIIVVVLILIGGGAYYYITHRNIQTRADIDGLLRQYLPSDAGLGAPATKKTLVGMQKARLINSDEHGLMLDTAEDI